MALLVPALRHICTSGSLRAARWAPIALWGLLHGRSGVGSDIGSPGSKPPDLDPGLALMREVAAEAMEALRPSAVAEQGTPAAIQAACAVGRVCPRAFAGGLGYCLNSCLDPDRI